MLLCSGWKIKPRSRETDRLLVVWLWPSKDSSWSSWPSSYVCMRTGMRVFSVHSLMSTHGVRKALHWSWCSGTHR